MRYALTFKTDDGWSSVDTIIIDDKSDGSWYEHKGKIKEILMEYGVESEWADEVAYGGLYYVHSLANTDITLDINGEIL